jgi:hypothetical protein
MHALKRSVMLRCASSGVLAAGVILFCAEVVSGARADAKAPVAYQRVAQASTVDMNELCPKAENGAPDCAPAAIKGCRAKGFSGGSPVDVRVSRNCGPMAFPSRSKRCPTEGTVLRAMCTP